MNNNALIPTVNVHELKKLLDIEANLYLIDIREHIERKEMYIPNAIHIPKDELTNTITTHIPDFNQPIYLHCQSGIRSLYAAEKLLDMGYQHIYSVNGGIIEWAQHHYPIIKNQN